VLGVQGAGPGTELVLPTSCSQPGPALQPARCQCRFIPLLPSCWRLTPGSTRRPAQVRQLPRADHHRPAGARYRRAAGARAGAAAGWGCSACLRRHAASWPGSQAAGSSQVQQAGTRLGPDASRSSRLCRPPAPVPPPPRPSHRPPPLPRPCPAGVPGHQLRPAHPAGELPAQDWPLRPLRPQGRGHQLRDQGERRRGWAVQAERGVAVQAGAGCCCVVQIAQPAAPRAGRCRVLSAPAPPPACLCRTTSACSRTSRSSTTPSSRSCPPTWRT
jgi:hypothetical protein